MARWHPHTSLKLPAHPQHSLALAPFASHLFCFAYFSDFIKLCRIHVLLTECFYNAPSYYQNWLIWNQPPSVWHLWGIMVVGKWGWVGSKIKNKVTSGVTTNTSIYVNCKAVQGAKYVRDLLTIPVIRRTRRFSMLLLGSCVLQRDALSEWARVCGPVSKHTHPGTN